MNVFGEDISNRQTGMRRRRRIRRMVTIVQFLLALGWFCGFLAAAETPPVGPSAQTIEYYRDVLPILEAKCLACHNASRHENGVVLDSSESLLRGGASGPVVVPGHPDQSVLFLAASGKGDSPMPPMPNAVQATPLGAGELAVLRDWIARGAVSGMRPDSETVQWQPIPETFKSVYSLALFPDQRYLAAGRGNRIFLYDLLSERESCRLSDPGLMSLERNHQPLYGAGVAHRDFVHSLAVSPDGQLLASGGYRAIKLWEREPPVRVASIVFPGPWRTCLISPSGKLLACVLETNEVLLWDVQTARLTGKVNPREQKVNCVCFTADESTLVTGGEQGLMEFWQTCDLARTSELATGSAVTALVWRNHGAEIVTAHRDGGCRFWHRPGSKGEEAAKTPVTPIRTLSGDARAITGISLLQDRNELVVADREGTVRIWNIDAGTTTQTFQARAPLTAVTVAQNCTSIITASEEMPMQLWNRHGQPMIELPQHPGVLSEVNSRKEDLEVARQRADQTKESLTRIENALAERSATLQVSQEQRDTAERACSRAETALQDAAAKHQLAEDRLKQMPSDKALQQALSDAAQQRQQAAETRSQAKMVFITASRLVELSEHNVHVSREQKAQVEQKLTLLQQQVEQNAQAVQLAQQQLESTKSVVASMTCAVDDPVLMTVGPVQQIQVWSLPAGRSLGVIDCAGTQPVDIQAVANHRIFTVNHDGKAEIWDVSPRWKLKMTLGPPADAPLQLADSRIDDRVCTLAFSPDGQRLASGGGEPSRSGELLIWNIQDGKVQQEIRDAHSDTVLDVEFTRDGRQLVSGGADRFVKLFDVADGRLLRSFEGHTDQVLGIAVKADGNMLASAGADRVMKIWSVETGEQYRTIEDYSRQVTAIGFVGLGEDLLSCSGDRHVKFHKATTGQNDRSFVGSLDYVHAAIASPDQRLVIAGGEDGVVRVWDGVTGEQVATFGPPASASQAAAKQ